MGSSILKLNQNQDVMNNLVLVLSVVLFLRSMVRNNSNASVRNPEQINGSRQLMEKPLFTVSHLYHVPSILIICLINTNAMEIFVKTDKNSMNKVDVLIVRIMKECKEEEKVKNKAYNVVLTNVILIRSLSKMEH